ncbi:transposase [Streptomyces sp. NPDC091287]|uniref:transposase n=1 Tax=Streptomyces sp. NPDC091287 TaxID=3365988 RepID=UPI003830EBC4
MLPQPALTPQHIPDGIEVLVGPDRVVHDREPFLRPGGQQEEPPGLPHIGGFIGPLQQRPGVRGGRVQCDGLTATDGLRAVRSGEQCPAGEQSGPGGRGVPVGDAFGQLPDEAVCLVGAVVQDQSLDGRWREGGRPYPRARTADVAQRPLHRLDGLRGAGGRQMDTGHGSSGGGQHDAGVAEALTAACRQRRPTHPVIFHSDRGCQYTSQQFAALAARFEVRLSVGRTGQCRDNALAESFFSAIKRELLGTSAWASRAAARTAIFDFIEGWYNSHRLHSSLGYLSPAEYETALAA